MRFAEKRITQFEEKLAQLDKVEQELDRSIGTLIARQDSLDQARDDVQMLFATSESTLEDVKAISVARDEVQGAREMLDLVRAKADTMEQALGSIDERQRQIEQAEMGLSRADSLLIEIRVGLESLASQKAVVDHVIATSGKLTFQAKEARAPDRSVAGRARSYAGRTRCDQRAPRSGSGYPCLVRVPAATPREPQEEMNLRSGVS